MPDNVNEEIDDGAAYLAALKRSALPPSTSAAATGPALGVTPATAKSTADRRRSPRYKCQGSARLLPIGGATPTWATFTDISMHGCYVEASTPYKVGAVLELRLEANGFRVDAVGEVRVSYPGLGMGISLHKIAEDDRARLRELVRSVSKPSVIVSSRTSDRAPAVHRLNSHTAVADPAATLQALTKFFENRHFMGREEFLHILRKGR